MQRTIESVNCILSGDVPYHEKDNNQVKELVCTQRGHLTPPSICPPELSEQLFKCWAYNSIDRPSFKTLQRVIENVSNEDLPFYMSN